jgi:hypothetical protein
MANCLFDSFGRFELHLGQALVDFAAHPGFVSSLTALKATDFIRKKLLGIT